MVLASSELAIAVITATIVILGTALLGSMMDRQLNQMVHLVDDLLYSGATLNSAASVLTSAGLRVREASVIVGADRADRVAMMVRSTSLERITCLVLAPDLDLRI